MCIYVEINIGIYICIYIYLYVCIYMYKNIYRIYVYMEDMYISNLQVNMEDMYISNLPPSLPLSGPPSPPCPPSQGGVERVLVCV